MSTFTWISLYKELADRLSEWEHRQKELINFLESLRKSGHVITPLLDRDAEGTSFLLEEIDPFTFFGTFNRGHMKEENRRGILTQMKSQFHATSDLPTDFCGIPVMNAQNSWFVAYKSGRSLGDVARLWNVFKMALTPNPLQSQAFLKAFDDAIDVKYTKFNLTMGLYWIRPDTFVNLDDTNRKHLKIKVPSAGLSSTFYRDTIATVRKLERPFYEISYEAWKNTKASSETDEPESPEETDAPVVPVELPATGRRYWAIGLGEGGRLWNKCQEEKVIAIGWDALGDLTKYKDQEEIADALRKDRGPDGAEPHNDSRACYEFVHKMRPGDCVIAKIGRDKLLGVGSVVSEYQYDPSRSEYHNVRGVQWLHAANLELPENARVPIKTLTDVTDYPEFMTFVRENLLDKVEVTSNSLAAKGYSIADAAKHIFMPRERIEAILDRLRHKKNIVLQGPPGVGKTFVARLLAYAFIGSQDKSRIETVQFHQSYSYEDFIQGYRPGDGGKFQRKDGVFYEFCNRARVDSEKLYVFIIDEINRGNLSKIFGELLMLIESDKRGPDHAISLTYSQGLGERFSVPKNVHLIGLMNTADRSLAVVDYALRRRFAFFALDPQFHSPEFQSHLSERQVAANVIGQIVDRLSELNKAIGTDAKNLGPDFAIGHSYFCDPDGTGKDWYCKVIQNEIGPLLREYWFDSPGKAEKVIERLLEW